MKWEGRDKLYISIRGYYTQEILTFRPASISKATPTPQQLMESPPMQFLSFWIMLPLNG